MQTYRPWWHKLVIALMIVTATGFTVAGVIHITFMNDYIRGEQIRLMKSSAEEIERVAGSYVRTASGSSMTSISVELEYDHMSYIIENESEHLGNACIWLVNSAGYIWLECPEIPGSVRVRYMSEGDARMRLPEDAVTALNSMETDETEMTGDLWGVFANAEISQDSSWMTVARRFTVDTGGEELTFYVLISVPTNSVAFNTIPIIRVYMVPFLIALVICFVVAILISRPMSRQITDLSRAARKVAAGEFDVQLPRESGDEMGVLIRNFGQMTRSLEDLEKMRSRFVSDVSHELRTPMTSILGFVEAIRDGTVPEDQRDHYLAIIQSEAERLQKLTTDLLDLSRVESGQISPVMDTVNMSDLCRKCVESMEPVIDEKDISVTLRLDRRELYARCDAEMIQRVIVNILHNAVKFTPRGGTVTVSATGDGREVTVSVADSGPGLSDEDLAHIWDRFYKADKSRGIDAGGSGLGMSIAWNIIREHGGTISAGNGPEGGAVFSFRLQEEMIS